MQFNKAEVLPIMTKILPHMSYQEPVLGDIRYVFNEDKESKNLKSAISTSLQ